MMVKISIGDNANEYHFLRQWKLETCEGPPPEQNYASRTTYYERCCLLPGRYTLTCIDKLKKHSVNTYGWGNAYIEIDGQRYCDDFFGFKAMRTVSVIGNKMLVISEYKMN